jgi:protein-tyrosine-phosphatase
VKLRVLFLCATNGVQSPMAEALLKGLDSEHFEVTSAGIERGETHPLTIEIMKEAGIDLAERVTKSAHDVADAVFDFVITLCDRARFDCPIFQKAELIHWRFEDPSGLLDHTELTRVFRSLRDQIAQRVRLFALVQSRFAPADARPQRDHVSGAA